MSVKLRVTIIRGRLASWQSVIGLLAIICAGFFASNSFLPVDQAEARQVLVGVDITTISAGASHSCAVADGKAYCWGLNTNGQLGDSSTTQRTAPVAVDASGVLSGKTITAISAGASHTCAVADGKAYCWGLKTNGRLGEGSTSGNQITPVAVTASGVLSGKTVTAISAGTSHTCAVAGGLAYCWGFNANGQLGDNSTTQRTTPVAVDTSGVLSGKTVTTISVGTSHACAVADGLAYCWGLKTNGRLGEGSTSGNQITPVAVTASGVLSGKTVTGVSAGNAHSCAVADGKAYCWGDNKDGQTGLGTTSGNQTTPAAVTASGVLSGKTVTAISVGTSHACAVADGLVYCWGDNAKGQLGDSSTTQRTTPVAVDASGVLSGKTITAISAGASHACAVADGKAYCWGLKTNGRLGEGSTSGNQTAPVAVDASLFVGYEWHNLSQVSVRFYKKADNITPGAPLAEINASAQLDVVGEKFRLRVGLAVEPKFDQNAIGSGELHSCGIVKGNVYCWGQNTSSQLGDSSDVDRSTPVVVSPSGALSGKTTSSISAGGFHTCAVADGKAYCWGNNSNGRTGLGTTSGDQTTPAAVDASGALSGKTVTAISAGDAHTCAVADGKAYCWGNNSNGRTGLGTASGNQTTPAAVDASGVLSGKTVTAISAGASHACAVADGKAYCWGLNTYGQLGDSTTTQRTTPVAVTASGVLSGKTVTAISAGVTHTCAVADGKAYCWGENGNGRTGLGTTSGN